MTAEHTPEDTGMYATGAPWTMRAGAMTRDLWRDDERIGIISLHAGIPFDAELAQDICAALWAHERRLRDAP